MKTQTLAAAGWAPQVLRELEAAKCSGLEVGGASDGHESLGEVLVHAYSLIDAMLPGGSYWVIAGHELRQPKSRIVDHYRMWSSLRVPVPAELGTDWLVSRTDERRYFGVARKDCVSDAQLLDLWASSRSCWLIKAPSSLEMPALQQSLLEGWTYSKSIFPCEILETLQTRSAVAVRRLGMGELAEDALVLLTTKEILDGWRAADLR